MCAQAIDSLRAAMRSMSNLNISVWEEIRGICVTHHDVLMKDHEHVVPGSAGQLRLVNAGKTAAFIK